MDNWQRSHRLTEGGGLFGSSTNVLENVLPFLFTLWLSGKGRRADKTGQVLRRCYLIATLAMVACFAATVSQMVLRNDFLDGRIGWTISASSLVAGGMWLPVQLLFAAGFVAIVIRRRPTTA